MKQEIVYSKDAKIYHIPHEWLLGYKCPNCKREYGLKYRFNLEFEEYAYCSCCNHVFYLDYELPLLNSEYYESIAEFAPESTWWDVVLFIICIILFFPIFVVMWIQSLFTKKLED